MAPAMVAAEAALLVLTKQPISNDTHWTHAEPVMDNLGRTNLTLKLYVDCACFAVGVLVGTWRLLRLLFLPLWRQGWDASLGACQDWCHELLHCRRLRCLCCRYSGSENARPQWASLEQPLRSVHWSDRGSSSPLVRLNDLFEGQPTAFKNYFLYLGTCCLTFLLLFGINEALMQIFRIPHVDARDGRPVDGNEDMVAHILLEPGWDLLTHATDDDAERIFRCKFIGFYINGIVFLVSTMVLERWCYQPTVPEKVGRTIWVHGLPVKDQRLNPLVSEPFQLTFDELMRVENEIGTHFNDELVQRQSRSEALRARSGPPDGTVIRARSSMVAPSPNLLLAAGLSPEDNGEWVVDEWDAHLPHHARREPTEGWSVGHHIGAKGIFIDEKSGRALFVRKVRAASRIENVWVMPTVKQWRYIIDKLEEAFKQQCIYHAWHLAYQLPHRTSLWDRAWCSWYRFWHVSTQLRVQKLEVALLKIRLKKVRMCGSAFVTFREVKDWEELLRSGKPPKWWQCMRWLCWFSALKFGHVPFTSVTLEYEPAPHPDDIEWENMHVPRWQSEIVSWFLTCALLVSMVSWQATVVWVFSFGSGPVTWGLHSLEMLFINRFALHFPVRWIALAGKFRRKSEGQLREMHLNFWLLIINTIAIPLMGVHVFQQILQNLNSPLDVLRFISFSAMNQLPKRLFIGYLLDVTFLANLYQVLAGSLFWLARLMQRNLTASLPPPGQTRRRAQRQAKQEVSKTELAIQPEYNFGYYYAWTLSSIALTLLLSGEVPSTLLLAALGFLIQLVVDYCNFRNKVYLIGPEHEGVFVAWAIFYLRLCLSLWWLMMALGVLWLCADETKTCPAWVNPTCWVLVALGGAVAAVSMARMSYTSTLRRFFPGRVCGQVTPKKLATTPSEELSWDATPHRFHDNKRDTIGLLENARPMWKMVYESVEEVMDAVADKPSLEQHVQMLLKDGLSVQEVLQRIRGAALKRSNSGSPSFGQRPLRGDSIGRMPTLYHLGSMQFTV